MIPKPWDWPGASALALAAGLASVLGTEWTGFTDDTAVVWLANGLLLGALLRVQARRWPLYLLAFYLSQIAANLALGESALLAVVYPFGDFFGALLGAAILARRFGLPLRLASLREVLHLVVVGAGIGQALGAVFGALTAQVVFGSAFLPTWLTWWFSGGVGIIVVTPVILVFGRIVAFGSLPLPRLAELIAIQAMALAVTFLAGRETSLPLLFLVAPFLFWSALRFLLPGAALTNFLTAAAVVLTALDHIVGRLPVESFGESAIVLLSQLYLLVLYIPTLIIAALVGQLRASGTRLALAQERYRDFAETSSDWQWEMDEDLRFLDISPSHELRTGLIHSHRVGKRREDYALDAESESFQAHLADLHAHRPFKNFRYWFRQADGQPRLTETSGKPIWDDEGRFRGYRGTGSDITDSFEAEERFKATFQQANVAMLIVATDGRITLVNRATESLFGYTAETMAGMTVSQLTHPDDRDATQARMRRLLDGEVDSLEVEKRYRHKDGENVWGRLSCAAIKGRKGDRPHYFIATIQDATLQKQQEMALRDSEAHYRRAAGLARVGHWVWSLPAGGCDYCSDEAARLYGLASQEFRRRAPSLEAYLAWVHPDERENYRALCLDARRRKSGFETVVRVVLDDGSLRYHRELLEPTFDGAGRQTGTVGVVMDITESRELEEAFGQAQKLDAIGKLTGGVAHDMNNVLGVVIGNLEILREEVAKRALEREVALIDRALAAVDRGTSLTHRLLAFARQQPLSPKPTNAGELLRGMSDLLRRSLGEDVEIEVVIDGGLWTCLVDPHQLENVILNLSLNARDAMAEGGKLTIDASNARLDQDYTEHQADLAAGSYVCLAVTDTGSGMTEEVAKRAFDPFFTTKQAGQGTGLGLSMAHGFVKQSLGHIKIYSEAGEGTTVKVYLPRFRGPAAPEAAQDPRAQLAVGSGEVILLVEDDAALREIVGRQLSELGYRVLSASDGPSALRLLAESPALDLLLTDVILPGGMNGRRLAEACLERLPALRVLYMSGYTENAILHQGRLDDGVELIQKPFRKEALSKRVRAVLAGRKEPS